MQDAEDKNKLTEEQITKINQWFQEKNVVIKCECCKEDKFDLFPNLLTVHPFLKENRLITTYGITAYFSIICTNCGNAKFFNAILSKIMESEKKMEHEAEEFNHRREQILKDIEDCNKNIEDCNKRIQAYNRSIQASQKQIKFWIFLSWASLLFYIASFIIRYYAGLI